ncbi:MAG: hypothetical protein RE471_04135 [Ferroplasma sp.]|uniref:hypothetical protein n=1 Tax=Ferroplasma sp. TaxID=2591003 RepID=UPI002814FC65|nr:hypothetical protein [Ferroplasma sp.]WMT52071.1 MAG: hypothetical protein RE471_04135 [Ferroplasma sp.]
MNKKILVLMVVPILVAMGGTFAFSAFSGSSSVDVNGTAGHIGWQNTIYLVGTNASNTVITVEGANGVKNMVGQTSENYNASGNYSINLGTDTYNAALSGGEYTLNISNLAPNEYVILKSVVKNTGTVGIIVTGSSTGPVSMNSCPNTNNWWYNNSMNGNCCGMQGNYGNGWSGNSGYNNNGITPWWGMPSCWSGNNNNQFMSHNVPRNAFMKDLYMDNGYVYNVTEANGFGTSLSPGGTATMYIYLGLGDSNGKDVNCCQESSVSINIDLNVVSDP